MNAKLASTHASLLGWTLPTREIPERGGNPTAMCLLCLQNSCMQPSATAPYGRRSQAQPCCPWAMAVKAKKVSSALIVQELLWAGADGQRLADWICTGKSSLCLLSSRMNPLKPLHSPSTCWDLCLHRQMKEQKKKLVQSIYPDLLSFKYMDVIYI